MSDCPAYDDVCQSALSYIAANADEPVASIARNVERDLSSKGGQQPRARLESVSERLYLARRAICKDPFDRGSFDDAIAGLGECAEKRYLMAVAETRSAAPGFVPDSAAKDIATAMRMDPGNPEYLQFAKRLQESLADNGLREQIEGEYNLIHDLAAQGVPERGGWY